MTGSLQCDSFYADSVWFSWAQAEQLTTSPLLPEMINLTGRPCYT